MPEWWPVQSERRIVHLWLCRKLVRTLLRHPGSFLWGRSSTKRYKWYPLPAIVISTRSWRSLLISTFRHFPLTGLQTDDLCDHGGHCVNTGNTHYCKCPPDYTGSYCESQVDHCEGKPCLNGATCRGYVGGYTCDVSGMIRLCVHGETLLASSLLVINICGVWQASGFKSSLNLKLHKFSLILSWLLWSIYSLAPLPHVSVCQVMTDRTVSGRSTSAAHTRVRTEEPASTWWATTSAPALLGHGVSLMPCAYSHFTVWSSNAQANVKFSTQVSCVK